MEGQAMLQTRNFILNTQHRIFRVLYTKVTDVQLFLSCVLPATRAVKQFIENELKYLTIQAGAAKIQRNFLNDFHTSHIWKIILLVDLRTGGACQDKHCSDKH